VRLVLETPVAELPERVLALGALLEPGGGAVMLTPQIGEVLSGPLEAVTASGLRVVDVQTREPRLENVIVELLRSHAPPSLPRGPGADRARFPAAANAALVPPAPARRRPDAGRANPVS
jgi:hypothetical protein